MCDQALESVFTEEELQYLVVDGTLEPVASDAEKAASNPEKITGWPLIRRVGTQTGVSAPAAPQYEE